MVLSTSRRYPAPPEQAWEVIAGTVHWPVWGPSITAVEPADAAVAPGLRGRVRTPIGVWLPFEVTEVDRGRRWAWRVLGLPATTHRVEADGTGCRVTFEVPALAWPYLAVCRQALGRLHPLLTG